MQFDPNNPIVKLCAEGINIEGDASEALQLFQRAWDEATNDFEKFIAAHYVARHQKSTEDKLNWDKIALNAAIKVDNEEIKESFPSLYLNIGKCYEDLKDFENAIENYQLALTYTDHLPNDGYGKMIESAIINGLERVV
ncbi:rRNA adenine methyltransferase [Emticicia sp. SJ17W-69]|uniref:rRNA adenine methyltransferase n=1 Tax=Emticicia sp. SJ17W-69 TaxID=3421657 RepID=UPI003EB7B399